MKTISDMDMRRHMGEYLDEVRSKSETFFLERAGKMVAMLVPFKESDPNTTETASRKKSALDQLSGISADNPRSDDIDDWLRTERDNWGHLP